MMLCSDQVEEDFLKPMALLEPLEVIETELEATGSGSLRSDLPSQSAGAPLQENSASILNKQATETLAKKPQEKKEVQPVENMSGCYLTFETTSEGTLFLNWSETPIEGAYAYFRPKKTVPKFKFRQKGGKSELIRGLRGGTGTGMKRYFEGWAQFIKLAREYDSEVTIHHNKDVVLFYLDKQSMVRELQLDQFLPCEQIQAIAAIPPWNSTFNGVATMDKGYFTGTGTREGAALLF